MGSKNYGEKHPLIGWNCLPSETWYIPPFHHFLEHQYFFPVFRSIWSWSYLASHFPAFSVRDTWSGACPSPGGAWPAQSARREARAELKGCRTSCICQEAARTPPAAASGSHACPRLFTCRKYCYSAFKCHFWTPSVQLSWAPSKGSWGCCLCKRTAKHLWNLGVTTINFLLFVVETTEFSCNSKLLYRVMHNLRQNMMPPNTYRMILSNFILLLLIFHYILIYKI